MLTVRRGFFSRSGSRTYVRLLIANLLHALPAMSCGHLPVPFTSGGKLIQPASQETLAAKRRRRAEEAAKSAPPVSGMPPLTHLQRLPVQPQTRSRYEAHLGHFRDWMRWNHLATDLGKLASSPEGRSLPDHALAEFLDACYLDGSDLSRGQNTFAALTFFVPSLGGDSCLNLSRRSLKGWRRTSPARSRDPLLPVDKANLQ